MNHRKYISKKFVLRILATMIVMFSAVLFDAWHEGSEKLVNEMRQRSESRFLHSSHDFFYNQLTHFKLRKGTDKLFSGLLFAATQNEFLTKYHDCRAFHLLKAESLQERMPRLRVIHFTEFNMCHRCPPDDDHANV